MRLSWKHLKPISYDLCALALIALAVGLRVWLLAHSWPQPTSEEGTFGIEALHIAYHGQFPIFMYGQDYMGTLESYLAALYFHLFGVSWLTLRLSVVTLFAIFLLCLYYLTKLLYTPKLALFTLALLSFGSIELLWPEMMVLGGAMETLVFGTLLFLLATHLSLRAGQEITPRQKWLRLIGFAAWGCCAGLGLWSHLLVAPFVLVSGLLLLFFCRREIRTLAPIVLLAGFILGLLPLIIYNVTGFPNHTTLAAFFGTYNTKTGLIANATPLTLLLMQCIGTFLFTLPTATGLHAFYGSNPLPLPLFGTQPAPIGSVLMTGAWSLGYLLLIGLALFMAGNGLHKLSKTRERAAWSAKERRVEVLYAAQITLLVSALITLALFLHSLNSASRPWSTRYLVGLLVATPALLWPLWNGVNSALPDLLSTTKRVFLPGKLLRYAVLSLLLCFFAGEMLQTTTQMPDIVKDNAQVNALTHDLLKMGVSHVYSGYWQCDRFIFVTQEKLICAVLDVDNHNNSLSPGLTRYAPYKTIVDADPHAAYVFPDDKSNFEQILDEMIAHHLKHLHKRVLDGYAVYFPT